MIDWTRLSLAAELMASIAMSGDDVSLAEADAALDEIAGQIQQTRREISLEHDRLMARIG